MSKEWLEFPSQSCQDFGFPHTDNSPEGPSRGLANFRSCQLCQRSHYQYFHIQLTEPADPKMVEGLKFDARPVLWFGANDVDFFRFVLGRSIHKLRSGQV